MDSNHDFIIYITFNNILSHMLGTYRPSRILLDRQMSALMFVYLPVQNQHNRISIVAGKILTIG